MKSMTFKSLVIECFSLVKVSYHSTNSLFIQDDVTLLMNANGFLH
jgi:hypothetical protein